MKTFAKIVCYFSLILSLFICLSSTDENGISEEESWWSPFEEMLTACEYRLQFLVENGVLNSNKTFSLAIQIKETMEQLKEFDGSENHSKIFEGFSRLTDLLPLSVLTLIWNSEIHLLNKYHMNEYLYPVYDNEADSDRRKVFTWLPGGRDVVGNWRFTTENDGKSFFIKNVEFDEYLYAGDDTLAEDASRRNVFTWRNETSDEHEWIVEIVGDDEIMLKSKDRNEYFYGAYGSFVEGQRRKVFNWRESSACDDTCVWITSPEKRFEYSNSISLSGFLR